MSNITEKHELGYDRKQKIHHTSQRETGQKQKGNERANGKLQKDLKNSLRMPGIRGEIPHG